MQGINRGNPIDLFIENQFREEDAPVFYIVPQEQLDEPSQRVKFRIRNNGNTAYNLAPINRPNAQSFHFALVFRPGTLRYQNASEIKTKFEAATGTALYVSDVTVRPADQAEILYFSPKANLNFQAGGEISFLVNNLSAEAGTGSRSTQVQLIYNFPVAGGAFFSGVRNKHVDIINHDGRTYAPILIGMLGLDELLSTHTTTGSANNPAAIANTCTLYFIVSKYGQSLKFTPNTELEIRFPYYETNYDPYWMPTFVLGSKDEVNGITIKKTGSSLSPNVNHLKQNGDPVLLTQINDRNQNHWGYKCFKLGLGREDQIGYCRIDFENFRVSGGNESSKIFIIFRNLPGYWDTELELEINKTNLIMKDSKTGIRTNDPQQELDLRGNMLIHGQLLLGKPENVTEAKIKFDAEYQQNNKDDSAIIFAPYQDYKDHAWIRFHSRSGSAHNLEIQVDVNGQDHLALQPRGGEVGIGTDNPDSTLQVEGGATTRGATAPPANVLKVTGKNSQNVSQTAIVVKNATGNVGIGTDNPEKKLHAKGDIKLESARGTILESSRPDSDFDFVQADTSTIRTLSVHGGLKGGNVFEVWGKRNKQGTTTGETELVGGLCVQNATGNVGVGELNPDQKLVVNGRIKDQTGFVMPVGSIIAYGGTTIPPGWLECNGQAIPATATDLKTALAPQTTVPDLRSRFIVGAGPTGTARDNRKDERGELLSGYNLHATGGEQKHALIIEEMPPHNHRFTAYHANFDHEGKSTESQLKDEKDGSFDYWTDWAGGEKKIGTTDNKVRPHNNIPPYYALRYIIKW